MVKQKTLITGLISLLFLSSLWAQNSPSNLNQTIKIGKAKQIKTLIKITGGELAVNSETEELANVDFNYNKNDWSPNIAYTEDNELGKLTITALSPKKEKNINSDNICKVHLNNSMDYSLGVYLGAGVADLNFENFHVDRALFKLGVGSFTINLANTSIPLLKIEAGIGEATIDLSGKWKNNLNAEIKAGIGQINLIVPSDVGVKIFVKGFLGEVETPGYSKNGKEYTNRNYNEKKHKLEIRINGSIGSIVIKEK